MSNSKFKEIVRKVIPSKKGQEPCKGHEFKNYFKDMHGKHVEDCPNKLGCSHDCRVCKSIRESRGVAALRVNESMIRHHTTKMMNKAAQEEKRAEIAERAQRIQEERLEARRARALEEDENEASMEFLAEREVV